MPAGPLVSERHRVGDAVEAMYEYAAQQGWGDGLPLVPPTEERVRRMLAYTDRDPQEELGPVPPKYGVCTIEKVAINAVMAGCLPTYFPVVLTAIEAALEPQFNLYGVQATTPPCGVMLLVNGPIVEELEINFGYNVFGQGFRANATIGRAVRLVLVHVGGGVPGRLDRSTMGQPGKFSSCIAENEEGNPWEPFHVERGFPREVSTVTVHGGESPHNINDHDSNSGEGILIPAADTVSVLGNNHYNLGGEALLVFGPEHAETVARDGYSKAAVKQYIYEHGRRPYKAFPQEKGQRTIAKFFPGLEHEVGPDTLVPFLEDPDKLLVIVAGGAGKHSMWVGSFGSTLSVTRPITRRDGTPIRSVEELRS